MRFHRPVRKEKINFDNISLIYSHFKYLLKCCDIECFDPFKNALFNCSYSFLSVSSEYSATSIFAIPWINDCFLCYWHIFFQTDNFDFIQNRIHNGNFAAFFNHSYALRISSRLSGEIFFTFSIAFANRRESAPVRTGVGLIGVAIIMP